jgi:hypothetical protein
VADVTFLSQQEPVDEYGRALYAVARSVLRALLDQLGPDDLTDLNSIRADVTLRQLAKVARLDRDKGMRGDGFEWAVHEAIVGGEPMVVDPIAQAMGRVSKTLKTGAQPTSLLFGHERAKYLGFLDAVVEDAGDQALLLPDGSGRPFAFGTWVPVAAQGHGAEHLLSPRIQQVWKTDLFLGTQNDLHYAAATIKSNWKELEDGAGLRLGIVPEASDLKAGYRRHLSLHLAVLPDPNGFMGLFNDAYEAVGRAICALGKQQPPPYWSKPSAKAQRVQEQLTKYPTAKVLDIEGALNDAAQQELIAVTHKLVSVEAPGWLHMEERKQTPIIAPRPRFEPLD